MDFKRLFTSKNAKVFWINILLMVVIVIGLPTTGLYYLDSYTKNGEKIKVPNVMDENSFEAEIIINRLGLKAVVTDSIYRKDKKPGIVLSQNPTAGSEVKSGRLIYLTKNMANEPLVKLPDLANNSSRREAEAQLRAMGFKLTANKEVDNEPKDLVLGIMQGGEELHAGDKISKAQPLTLIVGAGEKDNDTIVIVNTEVTTSPEADAATPTDAGAATADEDFF